MQLFLSVLPLGFTGFTAALIVLVGIVSLLRDRAYLNEQLAFTAEYRKQLEELLERGERGTYEWLTLNAMRMQAQLGNEGIIAFRPPHENYIINHYPIVPNALAQIRKCLTDEYLRRRLPSQYHALIDDALMRHQGSILQKKEANSAAVKNPISWIAVGMQSLLALPLWLLASLGLLPVALVSRVRLSPIFQFFSGLVATIGFLSAVVGLVTGWEQFTLISRSLFASMPELSR